MAEKRQLHAAHYLRGAAVDEHGRYFPFQHFRFAKCKPRALRGRRN